MNGEVFAIVDGMPKSIGIADFVAVQRDIDESVNHLINGFASFSISCDLTAKEVARFARIFRWPQYLRLRRQAIAKARGKNWRNVR